MSDKDTEAGRLWDLILGMQLDASDFGIVCLPLPILTRDG
jgi:hypothetical protein